MDSIYFQLDLDVLDPEVAQVNLYRAPDGLAVEEALAVIAAVGEHSKISVAAITAYDPGGDLDRSSPGYAKLRIAGVVFDPKGGHYEKNYDAGRESRNLYD